MIGPQHKTAVAFLNTIFRDNDAPGFWNLISSEARGFFKGAWYSKGILSFNQLGNINPEDYPIKGQLDNVLASIRKIWDIDIDEYIITHKVIYDDQFHSKVNFIYNPVEIPETAAPTVVKAVFVPLVYELTAQMEGRNPVWKVDFLKLNFLFPVSISL